MSAAILEIYEAVDNINADLWAMQMNDEEFYLVMCSSGNTHYVEFLGTRIWCSEDDMREIVVTGDMEHCEPLETFLRHEAQRLIYQLNKVQLLKEDVSD